MRFLLLLPAYIICCTLTCFSQDDYVITNNQDTLRGKITILMPSVYTEEIIVKAKSKETFTSNQFSLFVKEGVTYHTIPYENKYRIMKLEHPGKYARVYLFRKEGSYEFGAEYLHKTNNDGKELPSIGFKKTLVKFLGDCNDITTADEKLFKRSNLNQLVDYYNSCKESEGVITTPVPVVSTKPVVPVSDTAKSVLQSLNTLKTKLSGQTPGSELLILIDDISRKVANNEKVPSYLVDALKAQTWGMDAVRKEVGEVIELLGAKN